MCELKKKKTPAHLVILRNPEEKHLFFILTWPYQWEIYGLHQKPI